MNADNIMPVSTGKAVVEQFSDIKYQQADAGKQLNKLFFNMMMKSMYKPIGAGDQVSASSQVHQQMVVDALTQELSDNFDMGFSKLKFEQQVGK